MENKDRKSKSAKTKAAARVREELIVSRVYGVIALLLLAFAVFSYANPFDKAGFDSKSYVTLSDGWAQLMRDGSERDIGFLPVDLNDQVGEPVTIRRRLPAKLPVGCPVLFIKSNQQNVSVHLDGMEIFHYEYTARQRYDSDFPPDRWLVVPLEDDCAGKTVEITLTRLRSGWTDTVENVYLGDKADIIFALLRENCFPILSALLLILLGIVFLLRQAVNRVRREVGHRNLYLGIYFAVLGLWLLYNSEIRQLCIHNILFARNMEFLTLMMLPVPMILSVNYSQGGRCQKTAYRLCAAILIADIQVILLTTLGIASLMDMLGIILATILAAAVFVVVSFWRIAVDDPELFRSLWAVVTSGAVLILCAVGEFLDMILLAERHHGAWVAAGMLIHAVGVTLDQTRLQRHMSQQVQRAEMESRAKSDFLANMSHEIRTPINAVLGMDEMILREAKDPTVREYAADIQRAGRNLLAIINDILDISRIESGRLAIQEENYRLSDMLTDVIELIQPQADEKGLKFSRWIDETMPNCLCGDPVRLRQVAVNLLGNAVKYTEQGSVTFTVDMIPEVEAKALWDSALIRGTPTDMLVPVYLRMIVRDTGIGIREEDYANLFKSFQRLDVKKNAGIQGTGLGLSIVEMLVREMHGCLLLESVYGTGSEFMVVFPQRRLPGETVGQLTVHRSEERDAGSKALFSAPDANVLVVDDNAMNRRLIEVMLKRTRVRVTVCESGAECLRRVTEGRYDLILMDHLMPEMDGIETLHRMRETPENKCADVPVIVLTANAIAGVKEQYLAEGFTDYMSKPIQSSELEKLVMRYLPQEKLQPPEEGEAEPDAGLPGWLAGIDGLDTAEGLRRSGSPETYLEGLRIYAETAAANADEIAAYHSAGDLRNETIKIHALKSTSRAIGASALGDFAERLEAAGRADDRAALDAEVGTLLARYRALGERLAPLLERAEPDGGEALPPIPKEKLLEAYDAIRESMQQFDLDAVSSILDALAEYDVPEGEKERCAALREAARDFDWDRIGEILA